MSPIESVGLLETQGLVAALHATDDMLKSAVGQARRQREDRLGLRDDYDQG